MSVPPGTLTDAYRAEVLDTFGALFGWREIESLRLPDRMTLFIGNDCYVNLRERDQSMTATGYEHFGVLVDSIEAAEHVWAAVKDMGVEITPLETPADGFRSFRFQHLLPLAIEVQYFPPRP